MQVVEVVWRHVLVGARKGRRRWPSVTALAQELGVAVSTTHRSLAYPVEIGVVDIGPIDGLVVLDPARLLVLGRTRGRRHRDLGSRAGPLARSLRAGHSTGSGLRGLVLDAGLASRAVRRATIPKDGGHE